MPSANETGARDRRQASRDHSTARVDSLVAALTERGVLTLESLEALAELLLRQPSAAQEAFASIAGATGQPTRADTGAPRADTPWLTERWQARVVAATLQLVGVGEVEVDEFRRLLDIHVAVWRRANADRRGSEFDHYAHWLSALEWLVRPPAPHQRRSKPQPSSTS